MQGIQHLSTLQQLNDYRLQHKSRCIGFVPTMGNLHAGHLSLVDIVAKHCDEVIVSIFVNPAQFAPDEDFDSYPRTLQEDIEQLSHTACTAVFTPTIAEVYPIDINPDYNLSLYPEIERLAKVLCGVSRPHFFYGVVKVVCRLFEMVQPDYACFGEKDYQQLLIISKITQKLFPHIHILSAPIKRNEEGLALSSRNNYLSARQLTAAAILPVTMQQSVKELSNSAKSWQVIMQQARSALEKYFTIDYLEIRNDEDLQLIDSFTGVGQARLFAAIYCHNVRLLDNLIIKWSH